MHTVAVPPSSEHIDVADSLTVNVTVPELLDVTPVGPPVIVTTGAVPSTVHVRVAAALRLPAASVPSTVTVWLPSASEETV